MSDITLCYTQTIDGQLATVDGLSQWIGGPESVRYWHQLRAEHDAVMVGVGTVLADNPRLTVRLVEGRTPLRVIVDSALRTPATAHVLSDGGAANTLLAVTERAEPARLAAVRASGATVLVLPTNEAGRVSLRALLAALAERGIASVMVEGGAQLITALLRERLASRLVVCIAPRLMGTGRAAVGELGVRDLAHMVQLADVELLRFGADVVLDGRLVYPAIGE